MNAQKFRLGLSLIAFGLLTVGCDTFSGVSRSVRLQQLPPRNSVETALRDVPEVSFEYHEVRPHTEWSLYEGVIRNPPYEQFCYHSPSAGGVLEIQQTEKGEKILRLYCLWINYRPPWPVIEQTQGLMDEVYASLRKRIPELPPPADVNEHLMHVRKE